MSNLIFDTIISNDLKETVAFRFGGERSYLCTSASMPTANVAYPDLVANIVPGSKPIVPKHENF